MQPPNRRWVYLLETVKVFWSFRRFILSPPCLGYSFAGVAIPYHVLNPRAASVFSEHSTDFPSRREQCLLLTGTMFQSQLGQRNSFLRHLSFRAGCPLCVSFPEPAAPHPGGPCHYSTPATFSLVHLVRAVT